MDSPAWVQDAVFYQIFPERFCNGDPTNDPLGTEPWGGQPTRENFFGGDLAGVIQKLDYIHDLGCNALYLNPIFKAGTNHKYDTHDYFQIDPAFGNDATFDKLVSEAHARDVRIVLDGVFNHCGEGFAPFQDVKQNGSDSGYIDWFDVYDFPLFSEPHPNYATCGGAHYLPRLNVRHSEVEIFVHKVALYWLKRGIDGWRLDVPYEIYTDFWRRFRKVVKAHYPNAYLVAEEWRDPSPFLQGDTFDGAMHYSLKNLGFDFLATNALTGEAFNRGLETLFKQLPEGSADGMLTLLGGHDTPRVLTACGGDVDTVLLLYTLLFTLPGAPMLYYGDENGMMGENDPDCRRTMVWDKAGWNPKIRSHVKQLTALRHHSTTLRRGSVELGFANDRVATYYRTYEGERLLVILNNTRIARRLELPVVWSDETRLQDMLCGEEFTVEDGVVTLDPLLPRRAWVLTPRS